MCILVGGEEGRKLLYPHPKLSLGLVPYRHEKSKIPFSYMLYAYSVKDPIGELNLKRALDEDTGVLSSFFSLLLSSSPLGQTACFSNVDVACKKVSNNDIYLGVWCFKLSIIRAPTTTIGSKKRLKVQSGVTLQG